MVNVRAVAADVKPMTDATAQPWPPRRDQPSKEQQWAALQPKVTRLARTLTANRDRREELEAAGRLGAWEAVGSWQPDRGPLEAWAQLHIKAAMLRALRAETTVLSRHDFEAIPKIRRAVGDGISDPAEIAATTGSSVAQVQRILTAPRKTSLDTTEVPVPETSHDTNDHVHLDLRPERIQARDAWVALRVTGLDGAPAETMSELGRQLGESKQNIRRRMQRALRAVAV